MYSLWQDGQGAERVVIGQLGRCLRVCWPGQRVRREAGSDLGVGERESLEVQVATESLFPLCVKKLIRPDLLLLRYGGGQAHIEPDQFDLGRWVDQTEVE